MSYHPTIIHLCTLTILFECVDVIMGLIDLTDYSLYSCTSNWIKLVPPAMCMSVCFSD